MPQNLSFRTKTNLILAGAFAFFLAIAFMARHAHYQFENTLVNLTKQQLLMIAKSTATSLERHLGDHVNSLTEIAQDPLFRTKNDTISANGAAHQRLRVFYQAHQRELESISILNGNGTILASVPEGAEVGATLADALDLATFRQELQPQISHHFLDGSGRKMVALSVPITVDNKLTGIACALVSIDTLISLYIKPIKFGGGAVPVLIDEQGRFLSPPPVATGESTEKNAVPASCIKEACTNREMIKKEIAAGRNGVGIFIAGQKSGQPQTRFIAYAPVKFKARNWGLGVTLPFSAISAPIKHHSRQALIMVVAVLLFFGIGTTLLFRIQKNRHTLEIEARYLQEIASKASELERMNRILHDQSIKDELTGLYNYRHLHKVLQRDFALAARGKSDYSCMIIDLDHFKQVNDQHGHAFGDLVLKSLGRILKEEARDTDVVARYGGEEFVILLPDTALEGSKIIAERIRARLESHVHTEGSRTIQVTASIGVASILAHNPESPQDLLAYADKALYQAKSSQRNKVVVYT
ncbi:MAG: diguanylate cyclase [Desulfobulbaceae bacterium]|nr:diguanylate cyclase [Desulfobulbaceae bacterium]